MKNLIACLLGVILIIQLTGSSVARAANKDKDEDRLRDCGTVLKEILDIPDNIPQDLLDKADCVVVYPSVLKAAFVVGGSYGRGAMTCRKGDNFKGSWGAPTMMALEGGSFGFQIGGQATDFVLLVMNEGGARGILSGKVKLGGDASVAAGPVGRNASAETDMTLRSEILSYSRSVASLPASLWKAQPSDPTTKQTSKFMEKSLRLVRSCSRIRLAFLPLASNLFPH